ncbi:unnamed protein product [Didymodactylos carnosus]|uniref:Uncharacterized protein n=1 Tax=Didymodactylos carnosus TaxID=1234261 RepID=A0A814SLC6_9BILA|nr:unnamed protein product [Didymodactylos carnosus]CAF1149899.1 unnamed protein product [Didymodactylos carnosus]CAF3524470.1 unnamed protein product [Didymodactylos carnosus]CAF3913458.1 unnamed protein product [Didymodactylos carnosus]
MNVTSVLYDSEKLSDDCVALAKDIHLLALTVNYNASKCCDIAMEINLSFADVKNLLRDIEKHVLDGSLVKRHIETHDYIAKRLSINKSILNNSTMNLFRHIEQENSTLPIWKPIVGDQRDQLIDEQIGKALKVMKSTSSSNTELSKYLSKMQKNIQSYYEKLTQLLTNVKEKEKTLFAEQGKY